MDLLILGVLRSAIGCVSCASKGTTGKADDAAQAGQEAL